MYINVTINQPSWRRINDRNWLEFLHFVCAHTFCRYSVFPALLVLFLCFCYNSARLIQSTIVPNVHLGTTWISGIPQKIAIGNIHDVGGSFFINSAMIGIDTT